MANSQWRNVLDPPKDRTLVEIRTLKNEPLRAVYFEECYWIRGYLKTVVSYANPQGWRPYDGIS